jgi:hypothetical protein
MLTMEMASRLEGLGADRVTCNCLDPGTVNTKMLLAGWGPIGIDAGDALDEAWLCGGYADGKNGDDADLTCTGQYFVSRVPRRAAASAYDRGERERLWGLLTTLSPEAAKEWDLAVAAASAAL